MLQCLPSEIEMRFPRLNFTHSELTAGNSINGTETTHHSPVDCYVFTVSCHLFYSNTSPAVMILILFMPHYNTLRLQHLWSQALFNFIFLIFITNSKLQWKCLSVFLVHIALHFHFTSSCLSICIALSSIW